jgi:hypothetical protein
MRTPVFPGCHRFAANSSLAALAFAAFARPCRSVISRLWGAQPEPTRGCAFALSLIACIIALLAACGTVEQRPPEQRVQTVEVRVPVPVPCFTEAERPVQPAPTPIDLDNATPSQKAAALAADSLADQLFMDAVEGLFLRCSAAAGKPLPEPPPKETKK